MVKSSTSSPRIRPMSSTINNRNGSSSKCSSNSHDIAYNSMQSITNQPYSKSVDSSKYSSRTIDVYHHHHHHHHQTNYTRDNSAVLRAITSTSASPLLSTPKLSTTSNRHQTSQINKFPVQITKSNIDMFEQPQQKQQQQTEKIAFTKYERIYNNTSTTNTTNGILHSSNTSSADDSETIQSVMLTINGGGIGNCNNYVDGMESTPIKKSNIIATSMDKLKINQQTSKLQNYHLNDYRNGGNQIGFYDNKQSIPYTTCNEQRMHFFNNDKMQNDHQLNQQRSEYGKIISNNNRQNCKSEKINLGKEHRSSRPIPMLPSPPSTPPPPLHNGKDYHNECQTKIHLHNHQQQHQNRFNNVNNNNNEVTKYTFQSKSFIFFSLDILETFSNENLCVFSV